MIKKFINFLTSKTFIISPKIERKLRNQGFTETSDIFNFHFIRKKGIDFMIFQTSYYVETTIPYTQDTKIITEKFIISLPEFDYESNLKQILEDFKEQFGIIIKYDSNYDFRIHGFS